MIPVTDAYKQAITGLERQIVPRVVIDLTDPDLVYGAVTSSGLEPWSKPEQLHDKEMTGDGPAYATLEKNRWLLDGSFDILPDDTAATEGQQGVWSTVLLDPDGAATAWVQINTSSQSVLQAITIAFSDRPADGFPVDFQVTLYSGSAEVYTQEITGNIATSVSMSGFLSRNVTGMRVDVSKWSVPSRRLRLLEILPGIYEDWRGDIIFGLDVIHQADFSALSLPYGTATLEIDNTDRRFDPTNKSGLFESIEARQGIPMWLGVDLGASVEYVPLGVFYQQDGGWATGNNGLTMVWKLVDIIGLISAKKFRPPATLPTTLDGWLAAIMVQIGPNFAGRYDAGVLGSTPLLCSADAVANITCGNLLRFVCQASGAYPVADQQTGHLAVRTLDNDTKNSITLGNMVDRPTMSANQDLAGIIYKLGESQYVVGGTNSAAEKTVSVNNPFITSQSVANTASRNILVNYGGNKFDARGRGDMANEIGDVDLLEAGGDLTVSARRIKQQFPYRNGILKNASSTLVQATGDRLYTDYVVVTSSGTVAMPAGVTNVRYVLVGGGNGGTAGTDGTWSEDGAPGPGGAGGKILVVDAVINSGQSIDVSIGAGGAEGQPGGDTTVPGYSSADGTRFDGYADIASGLAFGLSGAEGDGKPGPANTGNGGGGGTAGLVGIRGQSNKGGTYIRRQPTDGGPGAAGGSGCAVIYWDRSEVV